MTYEDIKRINASLTPMDIKGKKYIPVNERVKAFAMLDLESDFKVEIIKLDDTEIIVKGILDVKGVGVRENLACETRGSSNINRFNYVENATTSVFGRCLGMFGIGIDTSMASYEEVANANLKQEANLLATPTEKAGLIATIRSRCTEEGMSAEEMNKRVEEMTADILKLVGFNRQKQPEGMTAKQYGKAMSILNGGI